MVIDNEKKMSLAGMNLTVKHYKDDEFINMYIISNGENDTYLDGYTLENLPANSICRWVINSVRELFYKVYSSDIEFPLWNYKNEDIIENFKGIIF